jgi:hypothetical protein
MAGPAPGSPISVAAAPGNGTASVTWAAPEDDGGSPITGYSVTSDPDGAMCTTAGETSCTVGNLTNGTTYTFTVRASNANGTGAASDASSPVTPSMSPTPTLSALPTFLVTTAVHLSWTSAAGTAPVASYDVRVRRAAWNGAFGAWSTWLAGTAGTTATYPATPGATYCFGIRARNTLDGISAWSAERCTAVALDDRSLSRSGSWTSGSGAAYYRSTFTRSSALGARLTRTGVVVRRIAIVATTCPTCGTVGVYWGSTLLATVSLSSRTTTFSRLLPVATFPAARTGTLVLKVLSRGRVVRVDAVVLRRD